MGKASFINRLQEVFGVTKNEVIAVILIISGLAVGLIIRYNPFAPIHPTEYDSALSQKVYWILDSIAESENQTLKDINVQTNQIIEQGDTLRAIARYLSKKKELPKSKINIAIALKAELMRLPGVGEKMAEKILEYRKSTPFTSTQDLMNVKGIGKKKFEKIEPYIIFEKKK